MDPNIQVAFISVLATLITTMGVIAVAVINNRREREGAATAGVEAALDERDVLERLLSLIAENERKEAEIQSLKNEATERNEKIAQLMRENAALRLGLDPKEFDE